MNFQERFNDGRGYWLKLCSGAALPHDPTLLRTFIDNGADITEVDGFGFNCLFVFMSRVEIPVNAQEYKALRWLLDVFDNIHALDAAGNDVFAYVNELRDWPIGQLHGQARYPPQCSTLQSPGTIHDVLYPETLLGTLLS